MKEKREEVCVLSETENEGNGINDRNIRFNFENCFFDDRIELDDFWLCQLGDISCQAEYLSDVHCQRCFEISFVISGKGEFFTNGISQAVRPGDVCINFKGDEHRWNSDDKEPLHFFYLGVELKNDCDKELLLMYRTFARATIPVARDNWGLYESFIGAFREIMQSSNKSSRILSNYVEQIFILSYRDFQKEIPSGNYTPSRQNIEQEITCKIIRYIDLNILDMTSMTQIGDFLGYSYSYLSHVFSQVMHCSIKSYYDNQRFKRSLEFLNNGVSVGETADMLQYTSIQAFSKAFKNHFGVSPEKFLEIEKQDKDISATILTAPLKIYKRI